MHYAWKRAEWHKWKWDIATQSGFMSRGDCVKAKDESYKKSFTALWNLCWGSSLEGTVGTLKSTVYGGTPQTDVSLFCQRFSHAKISPSGLFVLSLLKSILPCKMWCERVVDLLVRGKGQAVVETETPKCCADFVGIIQSFLSIHFR